MATPSDGLTTPNLIRKYRKKLRQIERLERLNRSLSPDETVKVESKYHIRDLLLDLLSEVEEENVKDECEEHDEESLRHQHSNHGKASAQVKEVIAESVAICDDREEKGIRLSSEFKKNQSIQETHKEKERVITVSNVTTKSQGFVAAAATGDNANKQEKKRKAPRKYLPSTQFRVTHLEGHNDLIRAVLIHDNIIISASQDTTVKTWDAMTGGELKNFGGHTDSVTCLAFFDWSDAQKTVPSLVGSEESVIISGSFDCTLKIWSLTSGHLLKSIYTYNPITQIAYAAEIELMVVGTDTGKIELWNLDKGEQQYFLHAYDASVTGIKVSGRQLHTCSSNGTIKIYSITDNFQLSCLFESENVKSTSGGILTTRHVRSLELCERGTLIGDDARNIKILNWKKNEASKVPNHHSNFSSADAVCCHGDFVVASSYDLDSGLGYLNVRCSQTLEYLASLDDKETERILCVDFIQLKNGNMLIVSGGIELKIWIILKQPSKQESEDTFNMESRRPLMGVAIDSEDDDDDDDDDEFDDIDDSNSRSRSGKRIGLQQEPQTSSWMSWCTVL